MIINTNTMALNAYKNLQNTQMDLSSSLEKLSSGYRINKAADDASGLVISEGLKSQVSGLQQATANAQNGISVVQTAEGALSSVQSMLQRMRDLVIESANTGANDNDGPASGAERDRAAPQRDRPGREHHVVRQRAAPQRQLRRPGGPPFQRDDRPRQRCRRQLGGNVVRAGDRLRLAARA